ncbi:MAG: hypothetical protein H0W46_10555 [Acidimicrobiia bacterium]|nr:hypothetical protein [Acidimicrobiia bacterium]
MTATDRRAEPDGHPAPARPSRWRYVLVPVVLLFAAFWIWALFFASKEAVNRIDDRQWAARAEGICAEAETARLELADYRRVDGDDPAMLAERGDVIDRATDIVEQMLDDVVAVAPGDAKGQAIVPRWEADYRTYLADRRRFADDLRAGRDEPFRETALEGIPIGEKIATFAGDNEMPSCSPPDDLST